MTMPNTDVYEVLDFGIDALMLGETPHVAEDESLREMLAIADDLRWMPRPEFKQRLMEEVLGGKDYPSLSLREEDRAQRKDVAQEQILPSLFGAGANAYPVNRGSFVASFAGQAAMLALIASSGFWMVQHRVDLKQQLSSAIEIAPYVLPPAPDEAGGGGGGGDKDKLEASKGALPKLSREQITPPAIVVRTESPKLEVPPSVVVPQMELPQVGALGDPMSHVLGPMSNGTGSGGGLGSGSGGGVGPGRGPGVGMGEGGGIGGGAYRIGGGVSAPVVLYDPDPEYSEEARKAKYQGTVILWVVVGADGRPQNMRVVRSLGLGLDEKAIEAVKKWKFKPGMKNGQAVPVQVNVEVSFRLY